MLHILGMILKIAGILLVSILGLVLLLLLLVLFVPVCYRIKGIYEETPDIDARISWFFSALLIRIRYDADGVSVTTRIFGFLLKKKEEKNKDEKKLDKPRKIPATEKIPKGKNETAEQVTVPTSTESVEEKKERPSVAEKIRSWLQKIKCTIQKKCDKIKEIGEKKEKLRAFFKDEKNREAFRLVKSQMICLWKSIRPRKLTASCHFGFEDPALTGYALAAGSVLYPIYRYKINLYPDFTQKILKADVSMHGRIRIFSFLLIIIRLWKNKQIRAVINKFMK